MNFSKLVDIKYHMIPWDFNLNVYKFQYCNAGDPRSYYENGYSDIVAHLPFLEFLASQCDHVTEFGFRNANSAIAFIKGCKGKVVSYDVDKTPEVDLLKNIQLPCQWEFHQRSTIDPSLEIEETDFLFIDTLHTYDQVIKELKQHSHRVKKYIGFHNTTSCPEVYQAINYYTKEYVNNWKIVYKVNFNHGLVICKRDTEND